MATVSSGPITKFDSVFVSGTEYDNTNSLYCIDHEPCNTVNRLKLGMVVLVNGTQTVEYGTNNTLIRVADTITYEETVEGVVQSASADGLSLVVLGQVVVRLVRPQGELPAPATYRGLLPELPEELRVRRAGPAGVAPLGLHLRRHHPARVRGRR